jgi:hypothetical protein
VQAGAARGDGTSSRSSNTRFWEGALDLVLLLGLPQRSDELEFDLPGSARRVREAGMQRHGKLHRRARSLTRELGSPSTNAEMSAMLDFAILVSSTCPVPFTALQAALGAPQEASSLLAKRAAFGRIERTLTRISPASTSPLSSAADPPTTSLTTSCPAGDASESGTSPSPAHPRNSLSRPRQYHQAMKQHLRLTCSA